MIARPACWIQAFVRPLNTHCTGDTTKVSCAPRVTLPSLTPVFLTVSPMPLSFVRVACLVALLSLAACSTTPPRTAPEESPALLLISIDGLRPDYLGKGNTPHLDRLAREGVHAEWMNPSYPVLIVKTEFLEEPVVFQ